MANTFETLPTESLLTATGGVTASSTTDLKQALRPILHSLRDLSSSSSNNQSQQNNTLMMGMFAALAARR